MHIKRFPSIFETTMSHVAERRGLSKRAIKGVITLPASRQKEVTDARNIVWYLLHTFFQVKQDVIAAHFDMHRGSVRKACEWIEELREEYEFDCMMMDLEDILEPIRDEQQELPQLPKQRAQNRRNRRACRLRRMRRAVE